MRFHDALLRLYPKAFRERFGRGLLECMEGLANEPRYQGTLGRVTLAAILLRDALASAPGEWRVAGTTRTPTRRPTADPMDTFLQDIRFAVRSMRRTPVFVIAAVVSLGLGIGANVLVFSVLDGIILHPFRLPSPDRFVAVGASFPTVDPGRRYVETLSPQEFIDIRAGVPSLADVSAFDLGNRTISGGDVPDRVFTAFVWGDPLRTMGARPAIGRSFRVEETETSRHAVAVLSHRVWQSRFGGDTAVLGRAVRVNGVPHTVIGVLPSEALLMGTDLWVPMGVPPANLPRQQRQFAILGRLREGVDLSQVNRELARVAEVTTTSWKAEHPVYDRWSLEAAPWHVALTSEDGVRQAGFVLQAAVFLVLLIAWVNVAGLLVARAVSRQDEFATRRALGAGDWRLTRQLLAEGLLLSIGGGALGLLLCGTLSAPLTNLLPDQIRAMGYEIAVTSRVLGMTLALSLVVGVAFALVPSTGVGRVRGSLIGSIGSRATTSHRSQRTRAVFQGAQVALVVMVLCGAGVLMRTMVALSRVTLGVDPAHVLTMRISVPREQFADSTIVPFIERLEAQVNTVPGVRAVGAATQFGVPNFMSAPVSLPGVAPEVGRRADISNVTPGYMSALTRSLVAGRLIDARDTEGAPPTAVLNATAARRFLGDNPIGKRLVLGDSTVQASVEVVGVVTDVPNRGLDAAVEPEVFVPARQQRVGWNNQFFVLIRGERDVLSLLPAVRRAIREVDAEQPVYAIATLEQRLSAAMLQRTAAAVFMVAFAIVALVLAATGLYGMVAFAVSQRTREIGVRMALGADARRVRRLILGQVLRVVGIGAAAGVVGALGANGALRAVVFGVAPNDPASFAAALALLGMVSLAAVLLPLRAIARVHPVTALRD